MSNAAPPDTPTAPRGPIPKAALSGPMMLGHDVYRGSSYGTWHPLRIPRVSTVMDLSRALGWLPAQHFRRSPTVKPEALHVWHTPDYVAALRRAEDDGDVTEAVRARHNIGTHANPVFPEIWRRPATSAGGSLLAGALLANGGAVHHPAGGTHHAMPDAAGGFCYLNDPVLSILSLRAAGVQRIAYVDIDAHHMDGVEHGLWDDPDCLLISTHEENRWPRTGPLGVNGSAVNLPLPSGLNDTEFTHIRARLIDPLVERFAPDAVVLQCGADAVDEDPLSRLMLSNNSHWATVTALKAMSPRFLALGGGGYNPWSVGRLWTGVWATLAGLDIPDRLPPEAEEVLRALEWPQNRRGRNPPEHWFTTLRDAPRPGPIRPEVETRVDYLRDLTGLAGRARRSPGARPNQRVVDL